MRNDAGLYLENLTWPEAEAAFKQYTTAMLPIEQPAPKRARPSPPR